MSVTTPRTNEASPPPDAGSELIAAGRAVGWVRRRLRRAGHGDLRRRLAAEARIARYVERRRDDAVGVRVEAGDPGVGERVRRRRAGALEVVVEPLVGEVVEPVLVGLRSGAAVVAAGEPGDPYGGAVRGEAARVGVRLGQREQRVRLALDEQRRRGDPVEDAGRAGPFEQRDRRPVWPCRSWRSTGRPGRRRRRSARRPGRWPASGRSRPSAEAVRLALQPAMPVPLPKPDGVAACRCCRRTARPTPS